MQAGLNQYRRCFTLLLTRLYARTSWRVILRYAGFTWLPITLNPLPPRAGWSP